MAEFLHQTLKAQDRTAGAGPGMWGAVCSPQPSWETTGGFPSCERAVSLFMICCNTGEICCLLAAKTLQKALHTATSPPLRLQAVSGPFLGGGTHKRKRWELGEITLKMTMWEVRGMVPNKLHFLSWSLLWPSSGGWRGSR